MTRVAAGLVSISFVACLASCSDVVRAQEPKPTGEEANAPVTLEAVEGLEGKASAAWKAHRFVDHSRLLESALAIREKLQGPEHLDVAKCLVNLGPSYGLIFRESEGETCLKRALAIREKALGHDHLLVAETFDSLAEYYRMTPGWEENPVLSDPMLMLKTFSKASEIRRKVAGTESLEFAVSLHKIGALSSRMLRVLGTAQKLESIAFGIEKDPKKERAAEEDKDIPTHLLRMALKIREEKLGPDHPLVAETLISLAASLSNQEKNAEAESTARRALAIFEKVQGPDGPDVARCLDFCAKIHRQAGKDFLQALKGSRELNLRAKAIREKDEAVKRASSGEEPR